MPRKKQPVAEPAAPETGVVKFEADHTKDDDHVELVSLADGTDGTVAEAPPLPEDLAYVGLLIWADAVDAIERSRIATNNRLFALREVKGLPDHVVQDLTRLRAFADALETIEHEAILGLQRAMRAHPLGNFVARHKGLGEKQMARLLSSIGDPASRANPAKLWAYLGLHVVPAPGHTDVETAGIAPTRRRGERANWNATARMRAYLVATSCIKQMGSHYREVYDKARAKYADATHKFDCIRCGPSGNPAKAGSELSDGHKHARAIRKVMKAILKDLWIEAKTVKGEL